jgi:uncharacterized protein (DUF58 family)
MASAADTATLRQGAERLAAPLPPLLVAAERVASTVIQGVHGRRRVGQGEAFWQFRRYQPGDGANRIDWRQTARGQSVFVRENEWEAAESVWLWRDASPSMDYASARTLETKRHRAELLTLALAVLLLRAGERVALIGHPAAPSAGRGVLNRIAALLSGLTPGLSSEPPANGQGQPPLPRFAKLVMVGDFLDPMDEIQRCVAGYAANGVGGALVQVLDPAEMSLPFKGRIRYEGMEQDGALLVRRSQDIREAYQARMADQQAGLADIAHRHGWHFHAHVTDRPPQQALLTLFMALSRTAD